MKTLPASSTSFSWNQIYTKYRPIKAPSIWTWLPSSCPPTTNCRLRIWKSTVNRPRTRIWIVISRATPSIDFSTRASMCRRRLAPGIACEIISLWIRITIDRVRAGNGRPREAKRSTKVSRIYWKSKRSNRRRF